MQLIKITTIVLLFFFILVNLPGMAEEANTLTPGEAVSLHGYPLSLEEAVRLTLKNNFDIHIGRIERKINTYDIQSAKSIYDTELTADVGYTIDEEEPPSIILPDKQNVTDWNVSLSKKFFTGTELSFDFLNRRNSAPSTFTALNPYYTSDMKASLRQPLLKNSFGFQDRGTIKLVELDVSRLDLDILDRIEEDIAEVYNTYWDLVFAYGDVEAKEKALEHAQNFLKTTEQQYDSGASEDTDLFAAQANVKQRTSDLLQARNNASDTSDDLKFAMNFFPQYDLRPTDTAALNNIELNRDNNIVRALEGRRDYKAAIINVESKELSVKLKNNSRLPQLDLVASYTANGLAREMIDAVGEAAGLDDPTYFIGGEFTFPLENRKARAEFSQAELEKAKALWEIKQIEKQIIVEVDQSLREILLKQKQVTLNDSVRDLEIKKLQGEEKKYGYGRSSSDIIIRFEDDAVDAYLGWLRALTDYEKAVVELKRNQNVLLDEIEWVTYEEIDNQSSE